MGDGDSYIASQGREVGRDGKVAVRVAGGDIGNACATAITGTVLL